MTCWNAAEAARRAGYAKDKARQIGDQNLSKLYIAEHVQKRISEKAMSADEVLLRLGEIARGSLKPFVRNDDEDVWPDLTSEAAQEKFHLLKKIKPKRRVGGMPGMEWTETEVELEIHDPMKALELLGKHHKLFTDKTELTGKDGDNLKVDMSFEKMLDKVYGDND